MNEQLQDPGLSRLWREHATETPSPALDQAILAAARREVGTRPQAVGGTKSGLASWRVPLAAAASVVLAVTVVLLAPENTVTPDERMPAEVRVEPTRPSSVQADSAAAPSVMKQEATPQPERLDAEPPRQAAVQPPAPAVAIAPAKAPLPKPEPAAPAAKAAPFVAPAPAPIVERQRRDEAPPAGPAAATAPAPVPVDQAATAPVREQGTQEAAPGSDKRDQVEIRRKELAPRGGDVAPQREVAPSPRPFPANPPARMPEPPASRQAGAPASAAAPPPPAPPIEVSRPAGVSVPPGSTTFLPPPQTASSPGSMATPPEPSTRLKAKSQGTAAGSLDSSPRLAEEVAKPAAGAPAKLQSAPPAEVSSLSKVEVSGSNLKRGTAEPPTRTPADWIELLRRLRRDARWDDYRRELAEFQRTHPDYRLPEDLR